MTSHAPTDDPDARSERTKIERILTRMRELEDELEAAFEEARQHLRYRIEAGKAVFEEQVLRRHKELRTKLWDYLKRANVWVVVTAPVIYGLIVPIILLDICVSIYQAVCFPVYGIEKVKRSQYIVFDREYLAYLNALEKLNCAYCSYANGVFAYVREVGARTEQHWCPIKHARKLIAPHGHYKDFVEFGDAEAYHRQLEAARQTLAGNDEATVK